MFNKRPITITELFKSLSLNASGNQESVAVDLRQIAQNGFFSLFYNFTGSGTLKLEYLNGYEKSGPFVEPSNATDIGATLGAGSDWLSFTPILAPWMKIKATEDGGVNSITIVTLQLAIQ